MVHWEQCLAKNCLLPVTASTAGWAFTEWLDLSFISSIYNMGAPNVLLPGIRSIEHL